jgi:hypothetical protein
LPDFFWKPSKNRQRTCWYAWIFANVAEDRRNINRDRKDRLYISLPDFTGGTSEKNKCNRTGTEIIAG